MNQKGPAKCWELCDIIKANIIDIKSTPLTGFTLERLGENLLQYTTKRSMPETGKQEGKARSTRSKKDKEQRSASVGSGGNEDVIGVGGDLTHQKPGDKDCGMIANNDLESLKQYMNFLHKNTENKFEKALMDNKNEARESFKNMEEKITGISTAMAQIKGNFEKLESEMDTRFRSMQSTIDDLNLKLSRSQTEIDNLKQQTKVDRNELEEKIKALQTDLCSIKEALQTQLNGLKESLGGRILKHENQLEGEETKNLDEEIKLSLAKLQATAAANTFEINQNRKNFESLDNKIR